MVMIVAGAFIALLVSHGAALYAGWRMGRQTVWPTYPVTPKQQQTTEYRDIFDDERLDTE